MAKFDNRGYFAPGDRINHAIDAIRTVRSSLIGDTIQAREMILALCDQADASIDVQLAVAALLRVPEESLPPFLKKAARSRFTKES
jgi:hypothetical protein